MKLTFIDKDFKKHSSFELKEAEEKVINKNISLRIVQEAIRVLEKAGISKEDIRVIDWNGQRLFHLKDFDIEKL